MYSRLTFVYYLDRLNRTIVCLRIVPDELNTKTTILHDELTLADKCYDDCSPPSPQ